ncbi:hypothetical protein FIBSPDRAFT_872625 [Athelia psychrophila]|uniref:Uncharacterized protein n=1 Tax=Athelia psychrophila TaxID=1759441 RepID=A0A165ZBE5_9AGAM|nr:hypothetical protein FIBSPDRAFT_872611 [Fibularhizoctonia sp. CBS 109695]KZP10415.1 hypothetical protein FIBSPDRAFT_872625 [Fibularhizoctonia sp. CBS 109695]
MVSGIFCVTLHVSNRAMGGHGRTMKEGVVRDGFNVQQLCTCTSELRLPAVHFGERGFVL